MSMITELIKKLREVAKKYYDNNGSNEYEVFKYLHEAADTIEELSTKLQAANVERSSQYYHGGWIPVNEQLPEDGKYVLIQSPLKTISIGYYCEERGEFNDRVNCKWTDMVKYWHPLPELYSPNEEGENANCD